MVGIEAEQFQELLVHEFRRQCAKLPLQWPVYAMGSPVWQIPAFAGSRRDPA